MAPSPYALGLAGPVAAHNSVEGRMLHCKRTMAKNIEAAKKNGAD